MVSSDTTGARFFDKKNVHRVDVSMYQDMKRLIQWIYLCVIYVLRSGASINAVPCCHHNATLGMWFRLYSRLFRFIS